MTLPKLAVEQPDGSRRYVHPLTGECVPSVTTVMDVIAKPKLIPWAAKMAARYAVANWDSLSELHPDRRVTEIQDAHQRDADRKSALGDAVHEIIDNWSSGVPSDPHDKQADAYVNNFIKFMTIAKPKFIVNEFTVWSRKYGYAGTGDWIAEIGGRNILGDNKTGRRVYEEVGLQLSALANADFIIREDGTEEPLPRIDGLAALHVRPRSWKLIPVYERGECFGAFLAARRIWGWQQETVPNIFQGELCVRRRYSSLPASVARPAA